MAVADNRQELKDSEAEFEFFGTSVCCHQDFPVVVEAADIFCMTTAKFCATLDEAVTGVRFVAFGRIFTSILTEGEQEEFKGSSQAAASIDVHLKQVKRIWFARPAAQLATHKVCAEWYFRRNKSTGMVEVVKPSQERLDAVRL